MRWWCEWRVASSFPIWSVKWPLEKLSKCPVPPRTQTRIQKPKATVCARRLCDFPGRGWVFEVEVEALSKSTALRDFTDHWRRVNWLGRLLKIEMLVIDRGELLWKMFGAIFQAVTMIIFRGKYLTLLLIGLSWHWNGVLLGISSLATIYL